MDEESRRNQFFMVAVPYAEVPHLSSRIFTHLLMIKFKRPPLQ